MLRQSPVDPDLLIAQKPLVAAVAVWMEDHGIDKLTQSLAMAAHTLVYQTICFQKLFSKIIFKNFKNRKCLDILG